MAYTNISELQKTLEAMDDAEQRRFMRRLAMETHVKLELHLGEERIAMQKLNEVHKALFDPEEGLVHLRAWMCRLARSAAWAAGGVLSGLAAIATIGHQFGIW